MTPTDNAYVIATSGHGTFHVRMKYKDFLRFNELAIQNKWPWPTLRIADETTTVNP